ncbi:lysozyme inhibitor LprI family protein [Variovorax sp. EBFNA2]|uniref:lysozyme inhibitor LprI family protein n=1 Tax=Variovorax sp. EBFNA2 TaxID=3342097 RepID=UPI0029C0B0B6|nr:lysozyme inhibitor LprI family protein [Variovorax boronicumulans]WPG41111.1 lysozyme inhibitor LprI family protein [Variovorax boronicumulans]
MKVSALLLGLSLAIPGISSAQEDCTNASDQSTLNQCAGKSYAKVDAELNAIYGQIRGRLKGDPETAKLLVVAQRAWVNFRDAECTFSSSLNKGGSMYPMVVSGCKEEITQTRIKDLQTYLNCKAEDGGCPMPMK